jgi:membrane protease YdiL (CAAX protease family)
MQPTPTRTAHTTLTLTEAAIVIAICFGLFVVWSFDAVARDFPVTPFADGETLAALVLELVLAAAALLYLRARGFDLATLRPTLAWRSLAIGAALYVATLLPYWLAYGLLSPQSQPVDEMVSASRMSLAVVVAFALVNASFEEVFLLGVLTRGLRSFGLGFAIGVPLGVRMLYHLYQGPMAAVSIVIFGGALAVYYVATRDLMAPIAAHVIGDIAPFL